MIYRYIKILLSFAVMFLLSLIFYLPFVYPNRAFIRRNKDKWFFWLFWLLLNDSTKQSEKDIDFGDYGRYKHNWIGAFKQSVLRNNSWNYRINYAVPRKGKKMNVRGVGSRFYNNNKPLVFGFTDMKYQIEGGSEWYFRKSATLGFRWYMYILIFPFIWPYYTYQFGAGDYRYIAKFNLIR